MGRHVADRPELVDGAVHQHDQGAAALRGAVRRSREPDHGCVLPGWGPGANAAHAVLS
ncbi:hypothetical protein ACFXDH_04685 [Streptomyces sp. NPDC059467]|uniref:hypothetical protein n=1 Tax=Streptomyces sp. NPDC059467 TaxID=3346844 RepID=UPI00369E7BA4